MTLLSVGLLTACNQAPSDPVLPPLKEYTRAEQAQAAGELKALPEGSVLARMVSDYGLLRAQLRGIKGTVRSSGS